MRSTAEIGAVRDPLRELGRSGRAADRGGHLRRGLRAPARRAREEVDELRGELERLRKEARRQKAAPAAGPEYVSYEAEAAGGVNVIVGQVAGVSADELLDLSDQVKQREQPAAVVLASQEDGRVHLVANFDRSLEARGLDAAQGDPRRVGARRRRRRRARRRWRAPAARIPRSSPRRSRRPRR